MVATIHYRWDFIGLSTQEKPTPETSDKVVDGSTFYSSDDSKLYVWYKDQWYERKALGGEGGGGSTINVVQTTGESTTDVMSQKAVTDALGGVGGGGVKELTADDYNAPASNPTAVALALLEPGVYVWKNKVNVRIGEGSDNLVYYQGRTAIVGYGNAQGSSELRKTVLIFGGSQLTNYTDYPASLYILSSNNWTAESSKTILTSFSIVDNLTSNYTYLPLSAKQGKVLNDKITALEARVAALEGN